MKVKNVYKFPLRLEGDLKKPLAKIAKENRWSINDVLNFATERFIAQIGAGELILKKK